MYFVIYKVFFSVLTVLKIKIKKKKDFDNLLQLMDYSHRRTTAPSSDQTFGLHLSHKSHWYALNTGGHEEMK